MGNSPSTPEEPSDGYHVLGVIEGGPAARAGLDPFFDYIIAANGVELDPETNALSDVLRRNADREMVLHVYSTKRRGIRDISIVPSRDWTEEEGTGLIGCHVRWCSYDGAEEHIWHVLEIQPNSPAEIAGLYPNTDYIIGTPHATLRTRDDLFHLVESFIGQPLRLYVYSSARDALREVMIVPSRAWGGEGCLGAAVGYGYLHKIPAVGGAEAARAVEAAPEDEEEGSEDGGHSHAGPDGHSHIHDGGHSHAHDGGDHPHSHDRAHSHSHDGSHSHSHDGVGERPPALANGHAHGAHAGGRSYELAGDAPRDHDRRGRAPEDGAGGRPREGGDGRGHGVNEGGHAHGAGGDEHAEHAGHEHGGRDHAGHEHAGHDHAGHDHEHGGHDHEHGGHDHAHGGHDHAHGGHDPAPPPPPAAPPLLAGVMAATAPSPPEAL